MPGWIADFFRAGWGLLYWNARKSWFQLRRGRSPCPCQNPSDSGRGWETGCEPAQAYRQPARFQRVCPLLKRRADGVLCCSVNTPDVRPFWGRAAGYAAAAAVVMYLAVVVMVFAGMRAIGYQVTPWAIAWPPAWSQVAWARSNFFHEKGRAAYASGRINEAVLSLSLAAEINPGNYDAGLMLAQLAQTGQAALSDREYARLMRDHPAQRPETARAWSLALLARGDFATLAELSADALLFDPARSAPWLHALMYAVERTGELSPLQRTLDAGGRLTPESAAILAVEWIIQTGSPLQAIGALQRPDANLDTPYGSFYRIDRLLQLGAVPEAVRLFQQRAGARMNDRERVTTQLALAAETDSGQRRQLFQGLFADSVHASAVELACAHLIERPEATLAGILFDAAATLPRRRENYRTFLALLCTAGVHRDFPRFSEYAAALREISSSEFATLATVEAFFRSTLPGRRAEAILPILQPLPVEVMYALHDHFAPTSD